jgi:hypothetical protein
MCPACQPPPIRDGKLNHDTLATARVFQQTAREDTLWYYRELANAFQDLLPCQLAEELMEIVIVLENE